MERFQGTLKQFFPLHNEDELYYLRNQHVLVTTPAAFTTTPRRCLHFEIMSSRATFSFSGACKHLCVLSWCAGGEASTFCARVVSPATTQSRSSLRPALSLVLLLHALSPVQCTLSCRWTGSFKGLIRIAIDRQAFGSPENVTHEHTCVA